MLTTERLVLRGPELADFDAFAAFYASDAARILGGPLDLAAAWRTFAADAGHWALKGFGWWTVLHDTKVVGSVGLHHPPQHADLEIGWNVYTPGQGIGTEAARAALVWAASTLRPTRVVSYIDTGNAASIALAEKLGAARAPEPAAHDPACAVYVHDLERYRS